MSLGIMETTAGEGEEPTHIAECTLQTLTANKKTTSLETMHTNNGSRDASSIRVHRGHESCKLHLLHLSNPHEADGEVERDEDSQLLTVGVLQRGEQP